MSSAATVNSFTTTRHFRLTSEAPFRHFLACSFEKCGDYSNFESINCPMHNLLTVKETAEYLRIPLPTVYYLVQRGKIPAIQIGGRWRIKKSALDHDILRQDRQGQPTVLVVDDDLGLQDLFRTFLKQIGFS